MSTIILPDVEYPTGDGKPMAETPEHRLNLTDSIAMLEWWFTGRKDVYISGNMLLYYVEGDAHRHVSPDVFVVIGIPKNISRRSYKTWQEPKPTLDFVIELTSESTRREDQVKKFELYQTVLGVREYCLFDPFEEYLEPSTQLFRLVNGAYVPVKPVDGRLPSQVLNLHIDRDGNFLRFWNPTTRDWIPTWAEQVERQRQRADEQQQRANEQQQRANEQQQRANEQQQRAQKAEALAARLQAELDALRKSKGT